MINVDEYLLVGQNSVIHKIIQKADTAGNYSDGLGELLATPTCIDMIIKAAVNAVDKHLPEGYITVGHAVEFVHDKATVIGMAVNVRATLDKIVGKRLYFTVTAWDDLGDIGHGRHVRQVIKREDLIKGVKERTAYLSQRTF